MTKKRKIKWSYKDTALSIVFYFFYNSKVKKSKKILNTCHYNFYKCAYEYIYSFNYNIHNT